ncbi:hypothetical protein TRFO_01138 [Tritrichomonas foetus]|uniref:Uncharacterized protein n=1 Tax=Tritrichomonas foetus TaxID=1144522 RepID=A0A1J4KIZ4_9EUKA|nr:hypothetical protein TRFO_01138 [Tritrichomonas foetus]|eukprot:OHT11203.1 hypothetical protein TRFO_01138 [Tritrichomonas foetus]
MELPETFKAKNTVSDESSSVEDPNFRNRGVSPLNSTAQYDRSPKSKEQIAKLQLNSIVGIGNTLLSLSGKNDSDDYSYEEEEEEEEEEENKSSQINENNKNIETSSEAQKTDFSNEFADDDDEDIHNDDFNKENSPNSKNKNKNETENKNINKSVNKNVINKFENEKNNQNESQFEIIHSERDEEEDNLDKPGIFELIETEPERSKNNEESFENEEIDFKFDELKNLIPEMSDVAINDSNPPPLELSPEKQQPQDLISSVRSNKLSGRSSKSTIKSPQTSSRPTRPSSTMASSRKSGRNSIFQITSPNNQNLKTPNTPPNAKGFSIMSINDPQTFRKYIDGELDNPRAIKPNYLNYMNQKRHLETMMTHDEIVDFCQHAISTPIDKIRKPYDSPGDIRDIIGELNRLKVDAVTSCDYKLSKKIDDLIKHFRTQFRIYDRESCQKERVNEIKRKLDDAKITIKNTTAQYEFQYLLLFFINSMTNFNALYSQGLVYFIRYYIILIYLFIIDMN